MAKRKPRELGASKPMRKQVRERPILFSGHMVRAILDGRKTQTRRIVKGIPTYLHLGRPIMDWGLSNVYCEDGMFFIDVQTAVDDCSHNELKCPYGVVGDRLWVRETFARSRNCWIYAASSVVSEGPQGNTDEWDWDESIPNKWKPSIFMPRAASRITLEIADVRVQRLQEIGEEDAKAEGVEPTVPIYGDCGGWKHEGHREAFSRLWNSINAKPCKRCKGQGVVASWAGSIHDGTLMRDAEDCPACGGKEGPNSWDANPFVWAITFKKVEAKQ